MRHQPRPSRYLLCFALALFASSCATRKEAEPPPDPATMGVMERIRHFEAELAADPDDAELHYRLGNALLDMGRFQEAFNAYRAAIERRPEYADAYANLGLALRKMGNLKAATGAYARALDINPDDPVTLANLAAVAQLQEDWERVAWCQERLLALEPEDDRTLATHADLLYRLGRQAEAAPLFERLAERGLDPAGSLYRAGLCYFDLGQWTGAIVAWERARAVEPENPGINRGLAVAHWEAGDTAAAETAVARCHELGIPLDPEFLEALRGTAGTASP